VSEHDGWLSVAQRIEWDKLKTDISLWKEGMEMKKR
jgi:hypothetical protein